MGIDAGERLIVALDVPKDPSRMIELKDALSIVEELKGVVSFFKVGWPVYLADGGHELHRRLIKQGLKVFLDLKFGDIPETVKRLISTAERDGVTFISLNTGPDGIRAAVDARLSEYPKVLALTLLSSQDQSDLDLALEQFILHRAQQAKEAGCDGLIVSGREISLVRERVGEELIIVSPGIRPSGAPKDDHKRALTPFEAVCAGADYLVVGRPITTADNPAEAAKHIIEEMHKGFKSRGW